MPIISRLHAFILQYATVRWTGVKKCSVSQMSIGIQKNSLLVLDYPSVLSFDLWSYGLPQSWRRLHEALLWLPATVLLILSWQHGTSWQQCPWVGSIITHCILLVALKDQIWQILSNGWEIFYLFPWLRCATSWSLLQYAHYETPKLQISVLRFNASLGVGLIN